jgi:AcrR family transcriptional regulator
MKKSLTKDDWLRAAMAVLRTRGIGGVRVLPLAKKLGVSRGSFYWHFENQQDLRNSMLDWWHREMTDTIIEQTSSMRGSAEKRLIFAAELILRDGYNRYDPAIRSWAAGDKKAAKVMRRVVKKRLDYIFSLFREAGFSAAEARARGDLLAVYLMSEEAILFDESLEDRLRLLRRQVRSLTN